MSRLTTFALTLAESITVDVLMIYLFSIPAGPLMYALFGTSFLIAAYTALE